MQLYLSDTKQTGQEYVPQLQLCIMATTAVKTGERKVSFKLLSYHPAGNRFRQCR